MVEIDSYQFQGQLPFQVKNIGSNPIQTTKKIFQITRSVRLMVEVESFQPQGQLPFQVEDIGSNPIQTTKNQQ